MREHDVIVIGAGPGGSATATFLANQGLDVLLLDKATFPRDKTCGDGLAPRAVAMLDELGILPQVSQKSLRLDEAVIYGPDSTGVVAQVPRGEAVPTYMLTIPRYVLDELIRSRAEAAGARFHSPVHVTAVERSNGVVVVTGRCQNKTYQARGRMAVIAIGASMRLLLRLGLLKEVPPTILAARAYYEDVKPFEGRMEFHFDGVPLPGYGWLFPLPEGAVNVGAGIVSRTGRRNRASGSARQALEQFLRLPRMQELLNGAHQVGPVKGYPIRTDFEEACTYGAGLLLVGESAGLVNPLTGEGIDYALESAQIAAGHLVDCFRTGDFSEQRLARYDGELRERFRQIFVFSRHLRFVVARRTLLNGLIWATSRQARLTDMLGRILLGNADAALNASLGKLLRAMLPW